MLSFTVPAVPVAQPRQHQRVVQAGGRAFATNYMPRKHPVNDYKATVRMAAAQAWEHGPLNGPLDMMILFLLPRPQSLRWKKRPMPRLWHMTKPDLDNLEKSTLDALKGILFVDDAQVCQLTKAKMIARGDEAPHVEIRLERLTA